MEETKATKAVVEGEPYPVFIERVTQPIPRWDRLALRIGSHEPGGSQITILSFTQARLLAYELLRKVERMQADNERLNEEARALNAKARALHDRKQEV